ncbi:MAG: hypothetical protein ABIQ04_03070 [Candidatus Saccharimonadales bacterium]
MKQQIQKNIKRITRAPMEQVRRRQAERTTIAIVGLHLPIAYQNKLGNEPDLQRTIDFLSVQPDGNHYLADVARLPSGFAMARRALRAITHQETQLIATADVISIHSDKSGVLGYFWKRRLRRRIGKVATNLVQSAAELDLKTILTLGQIADVIPLPDAVTSVVVDQRDTFDKIDESNIAAIIIARRYEELLREQEEEKLTVRYDPFQDDEQ